MKIKLWILKIVICSFMIPFIGTFTELYINGHKALAIIFVCVVSVGIVAIEETIKSIKRKFKR